MNVLDGDLGRDDGCTYIGQEGNKPRNTGPDFRCAVEEAGVHTSIYREGLHNLRVDVPEAGECGGNNDKDDRSVHAGEHYRDAAYVQRGAENVVSADGGGEEFIEFFHCFCFIATYLVYYTCMITYPVNLNQLKGVDFIGEISKHLPWMGESSCVRVTIPDSDHVVISRHNTTILSNEEIRANLKIIQKAKKTQTAPISLSDYISYDRSHRR